MLFDEKTQMGGTENCWLGREAAAMGPESWRCLSLKSVWQHHTYSPSLWHTHHTSTHGGVWLWICWVFFLSYQSETTKKEQCKSFGRNAQLRHKQTTLCNSNRARFIHCVILIFLLRYTVIAWSIPFETFSMGFVCLFVCFAGLLLFNLYEEEGNQWVVYFRLLSCCSVCKWFILFHHFCLKREVFLLGFLYGAHLFSI